jgi:fructan beta-fructosidase
MLKRFLLLTIWVLSMLFLKAQVKNNPAYHERYRLQVHFSPKEKWMNDPNGMVYYKGVYHLFFQYYPKDIVWGPMHWGHTVSKDLIHWEQLPIALYPDSLGYIFSGSTVIDEHNTSGLGKKGQVPLVAIFTHHDPKLEKAGASNVQNESLAYSLDEGNTWIKYKGNPVLKNPGIKDFRDPNVRWYEPGKEWIMTLATKDRVTFYSSPNLKNWTKTGEFGKAEGAHGGVWECPDLFQLKLNDKNYWVLLVSINPGGPNGGSATQYFIGDFNGKTFTPADNKTKWIDFGPDDYAGVTWDNTGKRKIFIGWMSNWLYANQVPTRKWRNAMTIPRELSLKQINGEIFLSSNPVKELDIIKLKAVTTDASELFKNRVKSLPKQYIITFNTDKVIDYSVILSNSIGEKLVIGYHKKDNTYFIDRTKSGVVAFNAEFTKPIIAPRFTNSTYSNLKLIVDASSVELFADSGLSNMTSMFFPKKSFDRLDIQSQQAMVIKDFTITELKSIWPDKK